MEQSRVYGRIHFLRELGQVDKTTRKLMIRYMTMEQMEALAEVVHFIVNGSIRVHHRDLTHLRERSLVLRQIVDPRISLRRKRNTILIYDEIIPRLLRSQYLNRALVLSIRTIEQ